MADPQVIYLVIPATYVDVRTVDKAAVDLLVDMGGIDEGAIHGVELAVHELCTNIVEHAYAGAPGGQIEVTFTLGRGPRRSLVVELRDAGKPFDSAGVAAVDLDVPHEGGYGLYLVRMLMDDVHYERQNGRNIWRLTKKL